MNIFNKLIRTLAGAALGCGLLATQSATAETEPFNRLLDPQFKGGMEGTLLSVYPSAGMGRYVVPVKDYIYTVGYDQISIFKRDGATLKPVGNYFKLSDPNPAAAGIFFPMLSGFRFPVVDGNRLYAAYYGDLFIFDVTNPEAPVLIARHESFFYSQYDNVVVKNNLFYRYYGNAFIVTDFTNPRQPVNLGSLSTISWFVGPVNDNMVPTFEQLTDGSGAMRVKLIDVSDPAVPVLLGQFESSLNADGFFSSPFQIASKGSTVYFSGPRTATTGIMEVIDFSDPEGPKLVNSLATTVTPVWTGGIACGISGSTLYLPTSSNITLYDLSDPNSPVKKGVVPVLGRFAVRDGELCERNDVSGNSGYTAQNLVVYDVSNAAAPQKLASISQPATLDFGENLFGGSAVSATLGDFVYTGNNLFNSAGKQVVDYSDPAHPKKARQISNVPTHIVGQYGFSISYSTPSLTSFDLSNPSAPKTLRTINLGEFNSGYFSGDKAVVVKMQDHQTLVYDLSKPANLSLAGVLPGEFYDFQIFGDKVAVLEDTSLRIYRLGQPTTLAASLELDAVSAGVLAWVGNHIYVSRVQEAVEDETGFATWESEVVVVDVSDPAAPAAVGSFGTTLVETDNFAGAVFTHKGLLFYQTRDVTKVYDISDPIDPKLLFSVPANLSVSLGQLFSNDSNGGNYERYQIPGEPPVLGLFPPLIYNSTMGFLPNDVVLYGDPLHILAIQTNPTITAEDDFEDGNDAGWLRYDIFSSIGHGTFTVQDGKYTVSTPASPSTTIAQAVVGGLRPDLYFSDSHQEIDVSGWMNGPEDAPLFALEARNSAHPDATGDFYGANFSPTPFAKGAGTPLSSSANFSITKSIHFAPVTLAIVNLPDAQFDPAKTYKVIFEITGDPLDAQLMELTGNGPVMLAHLQAHDSTLTEGGCGFYTMDKNGFIKAGNRPVQVTVDNYKATGVLAAPRLRVDYSGKVYFPIYASDYTLEASSDLKSWATYSGSIAADPSGLIKVAAPGQGNALFFRLKK